MKIASICTLVFLTLFLLARPLYATNNYVASADTSGTDTSDYTARRIKMQKAIDYADSVSVEAPQQAIIYYKKAIRLNPTNDLKTEADIRSKIIPLQYWLNNPEYIAQINTAKKLYEKAYDIAGYTAVSEMLAKFLESEGRTDESIKEYNALFTIQSKYAEAVAAGNTATYLTHYYLSKNNLKSAFNYADLAVKEYYRVCRRDSLGSMYLTIARIKKMQRNEKAAEYYIINKALPYFTSADLFTGRIACFNFLAKMYMDKKKFSPAKWFYLQAYTQALAIGDTPATLGALENLVVLKAVNGNYNLAKQDWAKLISMTTDNEYSARFDAFMKRYPSLLKKVKAQASSHAKVLKLTDVSSPINESEASTN